MPVATVQTPHGPRKLGRVKPAARPMCPRFAAYYSPALAPKLPESVDYSEKAGDALRRMYLNDTYGDCVIAGKMHQIGVWSGNDSDSGGVVQATDQEVQSQYFGICGPGDNGCVISEVLDYFRTHGLKAGGKTYKIDGYLSVDNRNVELVKAAIYLFGSLTIGVNLPRAWADSAEGGVWGITGSSIVGGHDICAVGYNAVGVVIATWGGLRTITWEAFTRTTWVDEVYVELAPLWYGNDGLSTNGFDVTKLKIDLAEIGNGHLPPLDPSPEPPSPGPVDPPAPVPPSPPAPPSPPVAPWYTGSVTGTMPGRFGMPTPVTLTGTFKPMYPQMTGLFDRLHFVKEVIDEFQNLLADLRPIADKVREIAALLEKPEEDVMAILRTLGLVD